MAQEVKTRLHAGIQRGRTTISGMRRAAVATAAVIVLLASSQAATASARTARIDLFPSQPRVGQKVTIQLRSFWKLIDGTLPPALFPEDYPWSVVATSPTGRRFRIRVLRAQDNAYLWSGVVRLRSPGLWSVCVSNASGPGPACTLASSAWQRVHVRRRSAPIDIWQRLERPFHVPTVAARSTCPTTPRDSKGDLTRIGFVGNAWGDGPAYPGLGSGAEPALRYLDPIPSESIFSGSAWFGQKVLWMIDPIYAGPVLVRGLQLDGPNELRFDRGLLPSRAIKIFPGGQRRNRPSFTRVRAPGCYAYQVDGLGFSKVIIFNARPF